MSHGITRHNDDCLCPRCDEVPPDPSECRAMSRIKKLEGYVGQLQREHQEDKDQLYKTLTLAQERGTQLVEENRAQQAAIKFEREYRFAFGRQFMSQAAEIEKLKAEITKFRSAVPSLCQCSECRDIVKEFDGS